MEAKQTRANTRKAKKRRQLLIKRIGIGAGILVVLCLFFSFFDFWRGDKAPIPIVISEEIVTETAAPESTEAPVVTEEPEEAAEPEETEPAAAESTETLPAVEVCITFGGDCTLAVNTNSSNRRFANVAKKEGYDYFFKYFAEMFAEDDYTVMNLEGPLTNYKTKRKNREFNFRGLPEYTDILKLGNVEAVNLANNHALDFMSQGLKDTKTALENADIAYFDASDSHIQLINGVRVGFLGYTQWEVTKASLTKAVQELRPEVDILIVSCHWGVEKQGKATKKQKTLGRAAIDAGADLVIGHHPHVVGGIEVYKGKRIVYSLGNFCFGGNDKPFEWEDIVFQETFSFDPNTGTVSIVQDKVLPIQISGSTEKNDFQPRPLTGKKAVSVLKRVYKLSKEFEETLDFEAMAAEYQ